MTTIQFKQHMQAKGLTVRKQRKLEVFDVLEKGIILFRIQFAELRTPKDISGLLEQEPGLRLFIPLEEAS